MLIPMVSLEAGQGWGSGVGGGIAGHEGLQFSLLYLNF